MTHRDEQLYPLLPAIHRLRDEELGSPLRALLGVMDQEFRRVEENIEDLYESWFIETAPEWVVPYIGSLVGNRPLIEVAHSRRTDVARTLYYRRRKGTLPMLEELARDVTGWGAHAVEFMERLAWTQNLNHLRYTRSPDPTGSHPTAFDRVGTINVRSGDALDRLDGPFDEAAHTIDVRRARAGAYRKGIKPKARTGEGWYAPRHIGFFLWRLNAYPHTLHPARRAAAPNDHGWHVHPFGAPSPLFTNTQAERDPARLAQEIHVPGPIRPVAFREDLEAYRRRYLPQPPATRPASSVWYGPDRSIHLVADGIDVLPENVQCKDLGAWARPPAGFVAVDVRRGRVTFATGEEPVELRASFAYGFSANLGGGPYDRRSSLAANADATLARTRGITPWTQTVAKGGTFSTIQQALAEWTTAGQPPAIIRIADSAVYGGTIQITLPADGWLVIEAAQQCRPILRLVGDLQIAAPDGGRVTLDGLLIEGAIQLSDDVSLDIAHSTLVPGRMLNEDGSPRSPDRDSIATATGGGPHTPDVALRYSICGSIRLPASTRLLAIRDSIVQALPVGGVIRDSIAAADPADAPGPPASIERSTIFGSVHLREMVLGSESIFAQPVLVQRRQSGCIRFSSIAEGSVTPRRFHCQPDLALDGVTDVAEAARIRTRLTPTFTSMNYGDPGFAQLRADTALEIRTGTENGAEMGAFEHLLQPQRETNLRTRLDEYLPFGLEAAIVYVT
jgi:hypothetical protein